MRFFCSMFIYAWYPSFLFYSMFMHGALHFMQGVTYVLFSATMAALQGSLIAVTGVGSFQWSKVCNIYTRFCVQVGGSLICGIAASLAMAVVSSLSAYRLFRLYPSVARSASPRRWRCWALL